jgi:putative acetyltransferase
VIVRAELPEDRPASIEVERSAFGQPLEAGIVEAVRDEPGSFALVAEHDGTVVGHVQMSRARVGADEVLALGPIAVAPDRQGGGIGAALVVAALEEARRRGEAAVILLGSPAYYGRLGFRPAATLGLANPFAGEHEPGFVIDEHDFQVAVLDDERASRLAGDVRWHPAFG